MNHLKYLILISVFALLSSCSNVNRIQGDPTTQFPSPTPKACPDGEISWIDMLMIDDIKYEHDFVEQLDEPVIEKGRELGKVTYTMADSACSNHRAQNGDATYLKEGTIIYEIKGYPTSLTVVANDVVYIAVRNQKAKTAGELYSMDKLVKDIHIQSTEDGKRLHTFSQSSKDKFLAAFYELELEQSLINAGKMDDTRLFLEIELMNGFSFRQVYWIESNTFNNGAIGNEEIKEVIDFEVSKRMTNDCFSVNYY